MTIKNVGYATKMHEPSNQGGRLQGVRVYVSGPPTPPAAAELLAHGAVLTGGACAGHSLAALLASELVVLLPGWESIPDCAIDVLTAQGAGIEFLHYDDLGLAIVG